MAEVTQYVRQAVQEERKTVILMCDQGVSSGFVEEVALAAAESTEEELLYFTGVLETAKTRKKYRCEFVVRRSRFRGRGACPFSFVAFIVAGC